MNKTIGQVAFEAYNASKGGLTHDGKPIPPWSEVGDAVRAGWEVAAASAVLAHEDGDGPLHDDAALGRAAIARARVAVALGYKSSRELSLVLTKLDEAELWLTRCAIYT